MMSDRHPARETLEGFLTGTLSASAAKAVVTHLLEGCPPCQELLNVLSGALFLSSEEAVELSPELDAAYDLAISAAYAGALEKTAEMRRAQEAHSTRSIPGAEGLPLPGDPQFCTLETVEALLDRSYTFHLSDPEAALRLADLAALSASGLDAEVHGAAEVADMQARAWSEVANAHRITGDLARADRVMARALDCRTRGTGDPRLLARLSALSGALACAQRRFDEAFRLLDVAYSLYMSLNDRSAAGRALIARGLYAGYVGDPLEGIHYLLQGLDTIDRAKEPKLAFQALHNIVLLRVELGEYEEASRYLLRMQPLYDRYLSDLERLKLRWVEGKIAAGLGRLDDAEAAFLEASQDFDRAGLGYRSALASLDLVAVWLRQGRTAEIRHLVAQLLATFRAVGVEREALAGILLLRDAVECEQATLELLQLIAISLGKLDGRAAPPLDPEIR
jgi:tetratricopeptide (TPR) repeat protein